jgi:hypothetical protein
MKKVREYKGFIIAELNKKEKSEKNTNYMVFLKEEWEYGEGCRYPEFDDMETIELALEAIKNWGVK